MQQLFTQNPWLILILQLWVIPWKGLALWVAANRKEKVWFIALLIIQTVGILEIIYLTFIVKYNFSSLIKRLLKKF